MFILTTVRERQHRASERTLSCVPLFPEFQQLIQLASTKISRKAAYATTCTEQQIVFQKQILNTASERQISEC